MLTFNAQQIAEYVNGRIVCGSRTAVTQGVAIDSRIVKKNDIFFALKGEVTDGHHFLKNAVEKGASVLIVEHEDENLNVCQIAVRDTFKALQDLAREYIALFPIPYVAITGSSGKTTTKDITASVLSQKYHVLKTQGNLNSTTGVPLTIFDLSKEHEIGVIEMSMSNPGEILGNAEIVRPETVIMTNVGLCHIEFLKTQENIFRAKSEILTYLKASDTAIINADDPYLQKVPGEKYELIAAGIENGDLRAEDIVHSAENVSFAVRIGEKKERFHFAVPGDHNVINCLSAIAVGLKYHLTPEQIKRGLLLYQPSTNRMEIITLGSITLINDTYNANPDSMRAAMDVLLHLSGARKIAVLCDMYELGETAPALHKQCGEYAADHCIDLLLSCGEYADCYRQGFDSRKSDGKCVVFSDIKALTDYLKKNIGDNDSVLFKASRGMHLENVFLAVKEKLSNE